MVNCKRRGKVIDTGRCKVNDKRRGKVNDTGRVR